MNPDTVNWIELYMEWTNADRWTFGSERLVRLGFGEALVDENGQFAMAYLDWMDSWQMLCESNCHFDAGVGVSPTEGVGVSDSGLDMLWDAYMVAAHTDSDCMPLLRRMIEAGTPREAIAA